MEQNSSSLDNLSYLREKVEILEAFDYLQCEKNLYDFVRSAFHVLEPKKKFVDGWHIRYLCEVLEEVFAGVKRRVIINIPPRHMKSLNVAMCWPVWCWLKWPESRWIFSSYSSELSTEHSRKRRYLIKSEWFQKRWADKFSLSGDQDRQQIIENTNRGTFIATSVGGTVAGKGGDFVIADDLQDPQRAESTADREAGNNHASYLFNTRLDDAKTSRFVLVMQRIHHADATAHVLALEKDADKMVQDIIGATELISLPAVAKKSHTVFFPKSQEIKEVKEGEILWEEKFPIANLMSIKSGLGSLQYSAQYDQDPTPAGGHLVRRAWWQRFRELPHPKFRIWSFDTAIKEEEGNDFTAGVLLRECENGYYVEKVVKEKIEAAFLEDFICDLFNSDKTDAVVMEDKSSGQRIIQYFKSRKKIPCLGFKPSQYGDKIVRLSRISPLIEAEKVYIPDTSVLEASWVADFLDEIEKFPRGAHDDQVDAFSQGMIYLVHERHIGIFPSVPQSNVKPIMPSMKEGMRW